MYLLQICICPWHGYMFFCWIFLFCSYVTQICSVLTEQSASAQLRFYYLTWFDQKRLDDYINKKKGKISKAVCTSTSLFVLGAKFYQPIFWILLYCKHKPPLPPPPSSKAGACKLALVARRKSQGTVGQTLSSPLSAAFFWYVCVFKL